MARHLSDQNLRSISHLCVSSKRSLPQKPTGASFRPFRKGSVVHKTNQKFNWGVKLSVVDQSQQSSKVELKQMVDFLYEDLPHLFDDQGIDRTMYDDQVKFLDPITKHDTISGYLFNINLLKKLFNPDFVLHHVKQNMVSIVSSQCSFKTKTITFPCVPLGTDKSNITLRRTSSRLRCNLRLHNKEKKQEMPIIDANVISHNLLQFIPRVLEERGIISILYDKCVKFSDPVTRVTSLRGLVLYFDTLRLLCQNNMQLHYVKETGPYEITTRWTMVMKFVLLPWKPELVFTGTSVMGINPKTQKFCSHVDFWDSIEKNDYFSLEGLLDVVRQLRFYKTPELESPKYQILKRTANYEVRKYHPFVVVETTGDKLSGSTGFNDVAGYIFGKNSGAEKIPMTTPVFTQAFDAEKSKIAIQIVLPMEKNMNSLPNPNQDTLGLRKMEGGIAAVSKFSGKPLEDVVRQKERALRSALIRDGLKPKEGCMLARYNDPGRTWSFIMRNEVLVWLEDFTLE